MLFLECLLRLVDLLERRVLGAFLCIASSVAFWNARSTVSGSLTALTPSFWNRSIAAACVYSAFAIAIVTPAVHAASIIAWLSGFSPSHAFLWTYRNCDVDG